MGNLKQQKDISMLVVIVCYKAAELTIDCLRSLSGQIADVPGAKVAVCENGTGGDAARLIEDAIEREGWSDWVMLEPIKPNRGFSGGNNAILREAIVSPAPPKYFMLLNADTIVHDGALRALYDAIEADDRLGVVGPRMLSPSGEVQNSCFRDLSPLSEFLRAAGTGMVNRVLGRDNFELKPADDAREYDWASFACAVIRREVLSQVGLLDEGYFLYFDDADYCRRARKAGWRIGYCSDAAVVHMEGCSNPVPASARDHQRRPKYYYVSRSRYFAKFLGRAGLWATNICWLAGLSISALRRLLGRKGRHLCVREWLDIWTNWSDPIGRSEPSAPAEAELPDLPLSDAATDDIGVVIIGRNEGRRLVRALDSVAGLAGRVVYVDSGSQDGSVQSARASGVEVVELDLSEPFTAARARNAGFDRLMQILPDVRFVQFVDGDCEIADSWFARAHKTMHQRPEAAIVCGRLSERNPEASIYNRLLDIEWDAPVGDVSECGGVAMARAKAFRQLGGFNAELIAGEEPELCLRLRQHGWRIVRIDSEMATHDAAMTSFGQWWLRAVRAGYTYAQGVHLHGGRRFRLRQATSAAIWAVVIPVLALAAAWATQGASLWILVLYPIQFVRIGIGQIRAARPVGVAAAYAACILLAKFAELAGLVRFAITHVTRGKPRLIEYKSSDLSSAKESL